MATNKTLYHTELRNMGPVTATVTSDVLDSKFQKKGEPPKRYVVMNVGGVERNYHVENEHCAFALDGLKGRTVLIEATGMRDDARIVVDGQNAPDDEVPGAESPAAAPAARQSAPATRQTAPAPAAHAPAPAASTAAAQPKSADPVADARRYLNQHANALGLAADAALYAVEQFATRHGVPVDKATIAAQIAEEMTRTSFTTLYIALKDSWKPSGDLASQQPVGSLNDILAKKAAAKQQ